MGVHSTGTSVSSVYSGFLPAPPVDQVSPGSPVFSISSNFLHVVFSKVLRFYAWTRILSIHSSFLRGVWFLRLLHISWLLCFSPCTWTSLPPGSPVLCISSYFPQGFSACTLRYSGFYLCTLVSSEYSCFYLLTPIFTMHHQFSACSQFFFIHSSVGESVLLQKVQFYDRLQFSPGYPGLWMTKPTNVVIFFRCQ